MATEIERKFLVKNDGWKTGRAGRHFIQGYLSSRKECTVRVRTAGERAWLTVKGPAVGLGRPEYEYEIPVAEAQAMLATLAEQPVIEKIRYQTPFAGLLWEVDEFLGVNAGLVVAELELDAADQPFEKPDWLGDEVTGDPRYFNSNLGKNPYTRW